MLCEADVGAIHESPLRIGILAAPRKVPEKPRRLMTLFEKGHHISLSKAI